MSSRAICFALLMGSFAARADGILSATCVPATAVRGEEIHCTVTATPPQAFILTERRSAAFDQEHREAAREPHAAGDVAHWDGPAIVPTRLRFTARINGVEATATAQFKVTPRAFPRVLLPDDALHCAVDAGEKMLAGPRAASSGASAERLQLAGAEVSHARLDLPPPGWELVDRGPDVGWYFVSKPISLPPALHIWLTPELEPGSALALAQYSDRSLPSPDNALGPHCRKLDIAELRRALWEGEGCSGSSDDSRFHRVQRLLATGLDANGLIEDLTEPLRDSAAKKNHFVERIAARLREIGETALTDEAALPPQLKLGCELRAR